MAFGCRAVADPQDFAASCQLDSSEQQDGQEFMKLLLEKLDEAFRASSDPQVGYCPPCCCCCYNMQVVVLSASAVCTTPPLTTHATHILDCLTQVQSIIPTLFSGRYVYETTCLRCNRLSDSSTASIPFYELTVPVKGVNNVIEGLVRGSTTPHCVSV